MTRSRNIYRELYSSRKTRTNPNIMEVDIKFFGLGSPHRRKERCHCSGAHLMSNLIAKFVRDESGATAIEYGLIAAIVAIGLIASLQGLKNNLSSTFSKVGSNLNVAN
jgi:pilus assembly protein Flp/PilA